MKNYPTFSKLFFINLFFGLFLMTNLHSQTIPDYSNSERKDVPVEFTWKLDDIYATKDAWKADMDFIASSIDKIDAMSADWTSSANKMLAMMDFITECQLKFEKLYSYAGHNSNSDVGNSEYQKMKGEVQSLGVKFGSKLSFINDDILKLGEENFKNYLAEEKGLDVYRFGVEQVFRVKEHILPSEQQKIVSMTGLFSGAPEQASSILNNLEIPNPEVTLSDGKKVLLNYSTYAFYRGSKSAEDRTLVMTEFFKNQKKFENTHATLLDGEIKQHYFSAKVRKYNTCLDARLDDNKIDKEVYTQLIKSVKENLPYLWEYLKIKKELLGLQKLKYQDLYASAVQEVNKIFVYDEAEKIIKESMKPLGENYAKILEEAFKNRWIDIYPNKGKESGAYSSGLYGVHPFIKMNYTGDYDAVATLTHELGHCAHSYLSDGAQHYANSNYPTFLAEIASTFNENLLMHYLLKSESDDMFKLYVLDNYLDGVRGTIFRQTLFAEFELAMHEKIENGESLTPDWLNEKYLSLTKEYYGHDKNVVEVGDFIQTEWSVIPHFYMNYYVFQYATGLISSMALSQKVLSNEPEAKEKYLTLLKSGGSDYPIELLKKAGVDMTKTESINEGLKNFGNLVNEMQALVKKMK